MEAVYTPLQAHTKATTWNEVTSIGPVVFVEDGVESTPSAKVGKAYWVFRNKANRTETLILTTETGEGVVQCITVVDEDTWEFSLAAVEPADFALDEGEWEWIFVVEDVDGVVWPLYKGVLNVLPNPAESLCV